ncbi:hypothetical protein TcG_12858, partial [Trypanosoma cruzi]
NGRSSDTVQGVPGVPWLEYAQPAAARSVPGNNAVLSMWWRTRRGPLRTASPGREIVVAAFQCIDDPMVSKRGCATHVLNIPETREAFVLCGCAETNDPPQRCWTAARWAEASFDDACGPRNAVQLPPCRTPRPWR